jgi:beta-galactosidase
MDALISNLVLEAGVVPVAPTRPGVEVIRRTNAAGTSWTFVINHTEDRASVPMRGFDLVATRDVDGALEVAAGGVAVVRSP